MKIMPLKHIVFKSMDNLHNVSKYHICTILDPMIIGVSYNTYATAYLKIGTCKNPTLQLGFLYKCEENLNYRYT